MHEELRHHTACEKQACGAILRGHLGPNVGYPGAIELSRISLRGHLGSLAQLGLLGAIELARNPLQEPPWAHIGPSWSHRIVTKPFEEHGFVDRSIVLAAGTLLCPSLTGALFCWQEQCFVNRSMVLSTGAMPCRPVHNIIDRSMPTGVLWFGRFGGRSTLLSQSERSMVLKSGAMLCRPEHSLSTGACHRSIVVLAGTLFCPSPTGALWWR